MRIADLVQPRLDRVRGQRHIHGTEASVHDQDGLGCVLRIHEHHSRVGGVGGYERHR